MCLSDKSQSKSWLWASMLRHRVSYLSTLCRVKARVPRGLPIQPVCSRTAAWLTQEPHSFWFRGLCYKPKQMGLGCWENGMEGWWHRPSGIRSVSLGTARINASLEEKQGLSPVIQDAVTRCGGLWRWIGLKMFLALNSCHCLLKSILEKVTLYEWKQICHPSLRT